MGKNDFRFEGTDLVWHTATDAASIITDEYFRQIGQLEVACDHDDSWFDLQEDIREAMLNAAFSVINNLER